MEIKTAALANSCNVIPYLVLVATVQKQCVAPILALVPSPAPKPNSPTYL